MRHFFYLLLFINTICFSQTITIDSSAFTKSILLELNNKRNESYLSSLSLGNTSQHQGCFEWSKQMLDSNFIGHKPSLWSNDVLGEVCLHKRFSFYELNLQGDDMYDYMVKEIIKYFMNSPSHKKILMKDNPTTMSFGYSTKEEKENRLIVFTITIRTHY